MVHLQLNNLAYKLFCLRDDSNYRDDNELLLLSLYVVGRKSREEETTRKTKT
jgi:hypothetical protein